MNRKSFFCYIAATLLAANATAQISTPALLDTIQHSAFKFFWEQANPSNGLIRDRLNGPCSIASVGFGLSAICIGVDHGWISRPAAAQRVLTTLKTFWEGPQGSGDQYIGAFGLFYHFLDMTTARRTWNSELSTIDTGLLLAGIVDARQYFDGADSMEISIRATADALYKRMNWNLMRNGNTGILMGYMPVTGFAGYGQWTGYNEASIMYILALGSPSHAVDSTAWQFWVQYYTWVNYYGFHYVGFAPLFGHQYSQCWLDLRPVGDAYMRDKGITYFENSRRATYAQRAYSIANPGHFPGYSDSLWGITASDAPDGYSARGAPPAEGDDGTIAPTAPIGSIPFAPEIVIPVIRNLWDNYRAQLWGPYGFYDAFNIARNWWDKDYVGIDQGPIIIMIENYLNQRVWNRFMRNPDIQRGLQAAGFQAVTGVKEGLAAPSRFELLQNYPNPFNPRTVVSTQLPVASNVKLTVYDVLGREVAVLVNARRPAGHYRDTFDGSGLTSGVYIYRFSAGQYVQSRKMVLIK